LKWLFHKITNGLGHVSQFLVSFGPFGLFTIALLDSAMVPLPGGVDAVLILLSTARPAWWPIYALSATLGSVIGCVILYHISKRAGRRALSRFSESKQRRVKELIDRYDVLSVLVASLLPPPFPFKLFVITTGVFRLNIWRFAAAIAAGRAFRFLLEGYLAAHYGEHAKDLLTRYYPFIGVGLAVLIVLVFLVRRFRRRKPPEEETADHSEEQMSEVR